MVAFQKEIYIISSHWVPARLSPPRRPLLVVLLSPPAPARPLPKLPPKDRLDAFFREGGREGGREGEEGGNNIILLFIYNYISEA